jgi:hypothetical protein
MVHDGLEKAWHWVYYHKMNPPPLPPISTVGYRYSYTYTNGKGAFFVPSDETVVTREAK